MLEEHILPDVELWKIFVLGTLRLDMNWNYDRLHDTANHHNLVRQILGHVNASDEYYYHLQTLKDNICLLTPELLDKIHQVVVKAGHICLKKKETKCCVVGAIPLSLKQMSTIRLILICCLMR